MSDLAESAEHVALSADPIPEAAAVPRPRARTATPASGPGTALASRYRLTTLVGADTTAGTEFWCARDLVLQRDVGVTVLRRRPSEAGAVGGEGDPTSLERANEMIVRALRSGCFEHEACARLLDVLSAGAPGLPEDVLGAAVSEWVPGRSLAEAVADGPLRPVAVARALQPLAAAVEEAHRHGFVLGCDQPQRLRVHPDGTVQLCFALPRADLRPADDVRGLGAILVTLLTARWPLSGADAASAGLGVASRTSGGALEPPSTMRPGVPVEFDALAVGTLGPATAVGHVHTAAAVNRLLCEVVEEHEGTALLPPTPDGLPTDPADVWQDGPGRTVPEDPDRRKRLRLGLAALAAVVLLLLAYAGIQVARLFGDPSSPVIVVEDTTNAGPVVPGARTAVAGVEPFGGDDGDNPDRVANVVDGDPTTSWHTEIYRQQLPALKPGVGIVISFAEPVQLSGLSIVSPSAGTHLEIRAAPGRGSAFTETVPMASSVLAKGRTSVSLAQSQPVQYVLVWIDRLAASDDGFVTEISELELRRALA